MIDNETWGGYNNDGTLNPTSQVMVDLSPVMIGIGGGDVGYAELYEGIQSNKGVFYQRAEMNRAKAITKAQKKGKPTPTSFFGKSNEIYKILYLK
ncbi:MAG: hypothetical protein KC646_02310 [Candidatus Cloacimonetes bacterium]|nr:hypothetical protein [Candidatus Cloacimonadota bacterium]